MTEAPQEPIAGETQGIRPHSRLAQLFHWGFIVVFVYALTKQLDEVEELEDAALLQFEMAFASFFLTLVLVRYLYMRFTRPTALPADAPLRERRLARAVHLAMYLGLGAIAVSGLVIGTLYGAGDRGSLGLEAALLAHEIAVNGTFFLIAGHVAAALYHRFQRDGIWNSMVPVWKERGDA